MDYNRTLEIVLSAVLGGGGLVGLLNWWRGKKSKARGVSAQEHIAVSQAAIPPVPLGTPDWEALTRYWQGELIAAREEYRQHRIKTETEKAEMEAHIDNLESWIWQGKHPPPPPRHKQGEANDRPK